MKFLKNNLSTIIIICITIMVSCIVLVSINNSEEDYNSAQKELIEKNINKAIVTCYSVEGFYPSSIEYLKDNYGLVINEKKYNVFYQALGSNLYPDVMVVYKGDNK